MLSSCSRSTQESNVIGKGTAGSRAANDPYYFIDPNKETGSTTSPCKDVSGNARRATLLKK
jgi:hypothetical protein